MHEPEECFENAAESRAGEYVLLLAPPDKKEEEYSRAPKARAEKIWHILRVFYASMAVFDAGFGKKKHEPGSLLKTLQNHARTNTRFCGRLATQRKKNIREQRTVCTFYVCFT